MNNEFIVKIKKMINDGFALGKIDDLPVFVEGAAVGETVKVELTKVNKNYLVGKIIEIIEPSAYRVKPICSLHNVCGSCNWQYMEYSEQLRQKQNIVAETLGRFASYNGKIENIIASPQIKEYRCKVQMPVSQTKVSKRILSGYYKKNSHELINIKYCPMQPDIINKINEFIKKEAQNYNISGYNEKTHSGLLKHIVFRISSDLSQILLIFVLNSDFVDKNIKKLSEVLLDNFSEITGVCANFNSKRTNVILGKETVKIVGNSFYIENLGDYKYQVSANSFFQVNPLCAKEIFNKVKELISTRIELPTILDAYSGVSSFGVWLSNIASNVVCVEEVESASIDAKENIKINNIKNLEIINGDAALEFEKLIDKGIKFDLSVTDPPRKGCSVESINNLVKLTNKYIVYVSCNIATLARDMKILNEHGFKTIFVQPADLFPNTYHVETIALFEKV